MSEVLIDVTNVEGHGTDTVGHCPVRLGPSGTERGDGTPEVGEIAVIEDGDLDPGLLLDKYDEGVASPVTVVTGAAFEVPVVELLATVAVVDEEWPISDRSRRCSNDPHPRPS